MCNAVITAGSMERDRAGRDGGATLYIYVYSALVTLPHTSDRALCF